MFVAGQGATSSVWPPDLLKSLARERPVVIFDNRSGTMLSQTGPPQRRSQSAHACVLESCMHCLLICTLIAVVMHLLLGLCVLRSACVLPWVVEGAMMRPCTSERNSATYQGDVDRGIGLSTDSSTESYTVGNLAESTVALIEGER